MAVKHIPTGLEKFQAWLDERISDLEFKEYLESRKKGWIWQAYMVGEIGRTKMKDLLRNS